MTVIPKFAMGHVSTTMPLYGLSSTGWDLLWSTYKFEVSSSTYNEDMKYNTKNSKMA